MNVFNKYLTLTSVVFELANAVFFKPVIADLTLTSVVFELRAWELIWLASALFNFNKCCIWIQKMGQDNHYQAWFYLTLTSVVFE